MEGRLEIAMKKIKNLEWAIKNENKPTVTEDQLPSLQKDKEKLQEDQLNMIPLQILKKSAWTNWKTEREQNAIILMDFLNLQKKIQKKEL
jgi:hypothetical protein